MNTDILNQALDRYAARMDEMRPQEVCKWQAVKHFQDTFDLDAEERFAKEADAV